MVSLRNQLLGVAAGFSAITVAQQATERLGAYQDIRTQITSLVGGQQQWLETEQYLIEVSKEHNKALIGMAGSYARVASIEDSGMITRQQTIAIFEGMSNAAATYGATNDQLGQSMFGLQQAMASQIVRAEELNQTVEPLPGLLTRMDKAAGLSAGGFRQMVNAGQVTSAFFAETLVKALASYDGAAARTAGNVNAMYGDLSTAYTQAVVAFEVPISDAFSPLVLSLTDSLDLLAGNAELISTAVGVTMALALGRGTAALMNMTAAKTRDMLATRSQIAALIKQVQATITVTAAEVARLETLQLTNAFIFRSTGGEKALAVARGQLTAATNQLSAAQAAASVSGRALNATMAFLGGPVGVVMLAASAIGYFALQASEAKTPTINLDDEVNKLSGSFRDLNDAQRRVMITQLGTQANTVRAELAQTRQQVELLSGSLQYLDAAGRVESRSKIESLNAHAQALDQQLVEISAKQTAIFNDGLPTDWIDPDKPQNTPKPPVDDGNTKTAQQQLALMQRQVALFGETSEAAKLRYDIEHGALKGINEELAKKLLLEAEKLDSLQGKDTSAIDAFYQESDELNTAWLMRLAMQADMENQAQIQEQYAYNERRKQLSASFQAAYAQARDNNQLQDELEREYFANREILRADHEANLTDIKRKAEDERQAYQYQVAQSTLNFTQQQLSITTDFLKQAGDEQGGLYRVLFAAQKLAAIPSMVVATEEAATKALSFGPPPVGMALSTAVRAMGYASVGIVAGQALAGQAHDGIDRVPAQNEGTWMLRKDEMVLNPKQADNFRWMVSMMQQMKAMQSQQHLQMQQQSMGVGGNPNINVAAPAVHVAFLDNQEQLKAYLRSDAGEQAVVKIVQRNRSNLN
ncbi:tape measure protein [Photobacterium nomapromontoriensis]|uniref:tape measure protein n=1 Tax=Photobacterium nomapromontoriensis TaxID=2910237 RepID=UPI003D0A6EF5